MTTYLTTEGRRNALVEKELPGVPPHIDVTPLDGSRVARLYRTNECGEPTDGEPIPVRWDEKLGAYVKV